MCGLSGILDFSRSMTEDRASSIANRMASTLVHRGPDDGGVWADAAAGIALSHRRLSIIDLSAAGHQPMASASGRFVIVYNGEIYNYPDLRRELFADGSRPRGSSDTEVMLAAFERWGVEASLKRFNGMFAFAVWDRREREVVLARDRFGEKPLYYGMAGRSLVFGSELKALRAHPDFDARVDPAAFARYVRFGYVPAPYSIVQNVRKLLPGTYLRISSREDVDRTPEKYWSLRGAIERGRLEPFKGDLGEATQVLDRLLRRSVRNRMLSDVPLGAFLSGGIDSSTIVALMRRESSAPVKTFTIGLHEQAYNEAGLAAAVARHLGTIHTELYVTPREVQSVIPRLPGLYDEPFADFSQLPTFLVSQLARQSVTVALSGDGGDEIFGGYNRYFWASALWGGLQHVPRGARALLGQALLLLSPTAWDELFERMSPVLPAAARQRLPGDKVHKLASVIAAEDADSMYQQLLSQWDSTAPLLAFRSENNGLPEPARARDAETDFIDHMMLVDSLTYLPDDILVKVDRAAMGVSLETRVPMLDPEVAEFAWSLPRRMKVRGARGKILLREVLANYVPRELFERPKMGFGIPMGEWLREPLRDWAEAALSEGRLRTHGLLNAEPIRRKWQEHLSGVRNWTQALWTVLMFQCWDEHWQAPLVVAPTAPPPANVAAEA